MNVDPEDQVALIRELAGLWEDVPDAPRIDWRYSSSNMFQPADATLYFALLRHLRPARLLEVGSGYTSALALDARDRHLPDLKTTFIEPYPDRLHRLLSDDDRKRAEIIAEPVQDVPLEIFDRLECGDVLFVDTNHFTKAGCEVNWMFFNVLPRLAAGVIVHIHDVFWPFEYPKRWVRQRRAYNELYLLRAFLMYNEEFRVKLFSNQMWKLHRELFTGIRPGESVWSESPPRSLWLEKAG